MELRQKYMPWPRQQTVFCGSGLQPDCFVSMEFDFKPTNRNPGRPSRNAMWSRCSLFQMEAYGWAIGTEGSASLRMGRGPTTASRRGFLFNGFWQSDVTG